MSDDAEVLEVVLQDGVLHGVEDLPNLTSSGGEREAVRLLGIRKSKRSGKGRKNKTRRKLTIQTAGRKEGRMAKFVRI